MASHVVSQPDEDFADGLLVKKDMHVYWRQTRDDNNLMQEHKMERMSQFGLQDKISADKVFFISSIDDVVGSSFDQVIEHRARLKLFIKYINRMLNGDKSVRYLITIDREQLPLRDVNTVKLKSIFRNYWNKIGGTINFTLVYVIHVNATETMLLLLNPLVDVFNEQIELSGAQLPMQAIIGNQSPLPSYMLSTSQNVSVLRNVNTTWIRNTAVRTCVEFMIKDLIADNYLPRSHLCFGDIRLAIAEGTDFAVTKLMCAYLSFVSIYRPKTTETMVEMIKQHVLRTIHMYPNRVTLGASGVATLNAIMTVTGERFQADSKILVLPNVYYEINIVNAAKYQNRILLPSNQADVHALFVPRKDSDPISAVFIDMSWSMALTVNSYFDIDNTMLIQELINHKRLVHGALVVLDVTIDTVSSRNIHEFMRTMHPYIISGRISVVIMSSLQKLYQYGLDRLSGGFASWYSTDKTILKNLTSSPMPPIIATGYSFFLHPKLNDPWQEYVDTVHSNNRYMYNLLQKTCKHRVTHVPSNTKMVNVDILSNDTDPFDGVVAVIEALPQQTIGIRASWGFRHTVMTVVDRKIRTSIGADVTKKQIEELAKAYCVHII